MPALAGSVKKGAAAEQNREGRGARGELRARRPRRCCVAYASGHLCVAAAARLQGPQVLVTWIVGQEKVELG